MEITPEIALKSENQNTKTISFKPTNLKPSISSAFLDSNSTSREITVNQIKEQESMKTSSSAKSDDTTSTPEIDEISNAHVSRNSNHSNTDGNGQDQAESGSGNSIDKQLLDGYNRISLLSLPRYSMDSQPAFSQRFSMDAFRPSSLFLPIATTVSTNINNISNTHNGGVLPPPPTHHNGNNGNNSTNTIFINSNDGSEIKMSPNINNNNNNGDGNGNDKNNNNNANSGAGLGLGYFFVSQPNLDGSGQEAGAGDSNTANANTNANANATTTSAQFQNNLMQPFYTPMIGMSTNNINNINLNNDINAIDMSGTQPMYYSSFPPAVATTTTAPFSMNMNGINSQYTLSRGGIGMGFPGFTHNSIHGVKQTRSKRSRKRVIDPNRVQAPACQGCFKQKKKCIRPATRPGCCDRCFKKNITCVPRIDKRLLPRKGKQSRSSKSSNGNNNNNNTNNNNDNTHNNIIMNFVGNDNNQNGNNNMDIKLKEFDEIMVPKLEMPANFENDLSSESHQSENQNVNCANTMFNEIPAKKRRRIM